MEVPLQYHTKHVDPLYLLRAGNTFVDAWTNHLQPEKLSS